MTLLPPGVKVHLLALGETDMRKGHRRARYHNTVPSHNTIFMRLALASEYEQVSRERILPPHALHQHASSPNGLSLAFFVTAECRAWRDAVIDLGTAVAAD
jgi:hypothetical protein